MNYVYWFELKCLKLEKSYFSTKKSQVKVNDRLYVIFNSQQNYRKLVNFYNNFKYNHTNVYIVLRLCSGEAEMKNTQNNSQQRRFSPKIDNIYYLIFFKKKKNFVHPLHIFHIKISNFLFHTWYSWIPRNEGEQFFLTFEVICSLKSSLYLERAFSKLRNKFVQSK